MMKNRAKGQRRHREGAQADRPHRAEKMRMKGQRNRGPQVNNGVLIPFAM